MVATPISVSENYANSDLTTDGDRSHSINHNILETIDTGKYKALYAGSTRGEVKVDNGAFIRANQEKVACSNGRIDLDFSSTGTLRIEGDAGDEGQVIMSQGASANPQWGDVMLDWTTTETLHPTMKYEGDDCYYRIVDFGAGPNDTSKTVSHGITGIDRIVHYDCIGYNTTNNKAVNLGENGIRTTMDRTECYVLANGVNVSPYNDVEFRAIYTKT